MTRDLVRFLSCWLLLLAALAPDSPGQSNDRRPSFRAGNLIDHPLFPFPAQGKTRTHVYTTADPDELEVRTFLTGTRTFQWPRGTGRQVTCRILRVECTLGVDLRERQDQYWAQADDGSVYQFGETTELHGRGMFLSYGESWLVGGRGPDDPAETISVRRPQLYLPGTLHPTSQWVTENVGPPGSGVEVARVVSLNTPTTVPLGHFPNSIQVQEQPDTESEGAEQRYFVPRIGAVRIVDRGGQSLSLAAVLNQ